MKPRENEAEGGYGIISTARSGSVARREPECRIQGIVHDKYLEWICGYAIEFFTEGGNSL